MTEPQGFYCPGCDQPSALSFDTQAFCGNGECRVMSWNPTLPRTELMKHVELKDLFDAPADADFDELIARADAADPTRVRRAIKRLIGNGPFTVADVQESMRLEPPTP